MYIKQILNLIKNNKIYLLICLITFILGILFSFFLTGDAMKAIFEEKILCFYSMAFCKEISLTALIFKKLLLVIILLIIILLSGIKIWLIPIHFISFIYQGYLLGILILYLSQIFSFVGILLLICAIIPSLLLIFFASVLLSLLLYNHNNSALLLCFLIAFMFAVIACIIELILLNIIIIPINLHL